MLYIAASFSGGFQLEAHTAVFAAYIPHSDILYAAAHFTAYSEAASARYVTVEDVYIFGRSVYSVSVGISARLDCYAVISCIKVCIKAYAVGR